MKKISLLLLMAVPSLSGKADNKEELNEANTKVQILETKVAILEHRIERAKTEQSGIALAVFAFAVLSALWAQNTNRSPWLWFLVVGLVPPIAGLCLLYKNSEDKRLSDKLTE